MYYRVNLLWGQKTIQHENIVVQNVVLKRKKLRPVGWRKNAFRIKLEIIKVKSSV